MLSVVVPVAVTTTGAMICDNVLFMPMLTISLPLPRATPRLAIGGVAITSTTSLPSPVSIWSVSKPVALVGLFTAMASLPAWL